MGLYKDKWKNLEGIKENRNNWEVDSRKKIKYKSAQAKIRFNSKQKWLYSFSLKLENMKMLLKSYGLCGELCCLEAKPGRLERSWEEDFNPLKYGVIKERLRING